VKFHHIGIVVSDLKKFESKLVFNKKIKEVFDPVQQAKLAIYSNYGDSFIELIQPENSKSFTWNYMMKNKDFGFHHLCYEIQDLNYLKIVEQEFKLIPILDPVPALLFENQLVAFYYSRNKTIMEFLILNNESINYI
jgi:hypothetical protein